MELPSMVQKSGGTLIVRSVVSGIPIYTEETMEEDKNSNKVPIRVRVGDNPNTFVFGEHLEELKRAQEHLMQQQQQSLAQEHQRLHAAAMELKEEGLPQCKIKRNYSCNYCTYFTQNPRYHLTHLRDVHGEKIVINKCKLCLYASRHYQKLVRHMKMVHGCTDGIASGHGQARGKRGMNREARKRKLEENIPQTGTITAMSVEAINAEHAKSEMDREQQKLQRDFEAFKKQQEEQQKSQQQKLSEAIFAAAAFEQQLRVQREFDNRESLKTAAHSNYEQQQEQQQQTTSPVQIREGRSPSENKTFDNATPAHSTSIQLPPQRSSLELTPSPSGSNSSPPPTLPLASANGQQQADASNGVNDEPSNNRLMKCSLCDFTTLYRNLLLEHELEDHCNAKFYRCEKCSYVTHIKARFSKHVKYHSMPMIKCVTCDFRTPYKWNLDRHMKNHGGAGPFKCAACDFTADIKQSLTVHEMNHHVPPVGHAAGMTLARRRNKVGGTDLNEDFFSDSAEMLEDHFNNNNMDDYDEMLMTAGPVGAYDTKRLRYDDDEPTDLSQKGGSSDTSSVHNSNLSIPKAKKPLPNLIPLNKEGENILNLSGDLASRSSLSEIASMFFNEKQISEMLQPSQADKSEAIAAPASQLSPTTTITSSASSRSIINRKSGSFFDKIKSSSATNENLICPCGHMAKCLSESIIHRKTCTFSPLSNNDDIDLDDDEHDEDGEEGRLEIDFTEDDECDKQSHSALNLSVSGSTRCQHCRHRCKSSADLLNHLKICAEVNSGCGSLSGDSCGGSRVMNGDTSGNELQHPMENRVFIWNKIPRNQQESGVGSGSQSSEGQRQPAISGNSSSNNGGSLLSATNDENSYYGVETAPGYGEMTPEEEAANSSLKKVYKCPHCSFWASTASRFHVHIVGHLNKKPFECSLCSYRSNWRWDITKHIRLKTIRDPSHKSARVLMNDETGRRNYTKYNKYITLMKVTEEDGDPKLMKSGEMTPNQVASLAFINDFNNKQQGSSSNPNNLSVNNILNGVREDITLEPIPPKSTITNVDDQLSDNFIRLPLLASMMNAAIVQQQQQQQNDNEQNGTATLITPSVTISAVKKSPPSIHNFKPSDEITLEIHQEGNEKITNYKCRKCNFRHINRDAVLAHVKVHFPDPNSGFNTPKTAQQQAATNSNGPLSVNSNLYMNNVLAAMCLSQQQQQNSNTNTQLTNLMAAGLLDQTNNSQLSGLALALAGKSPLKASHLNAAANIIEHGEQKASLNEASAQNTMTSPNQLTLKSPQNEQQTHATSSSSVTGVGSTASTNSPSLQHLLTSPRGSFSQTPLNLNQNEVLNNNNNEIMVLGSSTLLKTQSGLMAEMSPSSPSPTTPNTIVTTTTTPFSTPNHTYQLKQSPFSLHSGDGGLITGDIIGGIQDHNHHNLVVGATFSASSDHLATRNVINNNNNNNCNNNNMASTLSAASSCSTSLLSLSNQNYIQNQNQTHSSSSSNKNILGNLSGNGVSNNNSNNNNGIGNGNNNNNNNLLTHDTTSADRRDPSPYRCGHCHQVSNWKHVIQRHCRLKHAGVINIETLDRTTLADRHAPPVYKPLVNGATNESNNNNSNNNINSSNIANSNFNLTLKALQQQQQQQHQQNNNHNNNVLINNNNLLKNINNAIKSEPTNNLLHSPIAAASALNAANASQDLQAAAVAYLAAAAAAVANQNNNLKAINNMTEELILQQQLQQNDQIEITRVSSTNHLNNNNNNNNNNINNSNNNLSSQPTANNSNLAQLLESNLSSQLNRVSSPQNNSKSKQQKCPLCTYICDSKSQMNYHISLHKPTQYECRMCTFVCAKKQHLSSHMRTVHQVQQNQMATAVVNTTTANANNINMDFGLALQLAAKSVQNQDSSKFSTPLAIDLSPSPVARSSSALSHNQQTHQNQLPPEYQYRMIYYCNKCPARYAQKHNDPLTAQKDLDEHLRQHEAHHSNEDGKRKYHCDYCDYRALHESIIQTHRYVHTTQYQEKCNELYKNCKEDSVYRAPKLMHITATKKQHMHETIWVVDHDLNDGHQQNNKHHQNSIITSSSQSNSFETGNSLLKKQLESRQVANTTSPSTANEEVRSKSNQTEAEDSNTASTLASVATGDLAQDNEIRPNNRTPEAAQHDTPSNANQENKEKCEHCPFESTNAEEFKTHLHQHICVTKQKLAYTCDHCDYSAEEQEHIEEHTRVHFNGIEKLKDVSFFTRYDKLELSMDQQDDEEAESNNLNIKKELQNNHNNNNNNNEENRVNENLKDTAKEALKSQEQKQPKCAKIILYKNDGCLTIKKESSESPQAIQSQQQQINNINENISDRLRRRISRQGGAVSNNSLTTNQLCATNNEDHSSTSHKTILVNAKTGQVISRN